MSKSVKMQWIEEYATMIKTDGNRYMQAWRNYETGTYHLEAGYEGLGRDWHQTYDTLPELRQEMGDLRHWVQGNL